MIEMEKIRRKIFIHIVIKSKILIRQQSCNDLRILNRLTDNLTTRACREALLYQGVKSKKRVNPDLINTLSYKIYEGSRHFFHIN